MAWSLAAGLRRRLPGSACKPLAFAFGPPLRADLADAAPSLGRAAGVDSSAAGPIARWMSARPEGQDSGRGEAAEPTPGPLATSELMAKFMNPKLLSSMEQHKLELQRIRESFRRHDGDCGSTEVQIALLTERIRYMGIHLTKNRKDKHSRVGLDGMLARRRKLLKYLRHKDWDSYCQVISRLGLRDRVDLQK